MAGNGIPYQSMLLGFECMSDISWFKSSFLYLEGGKAMPLLKYMLDTNAQS